MAIVTTVFDPDALVTGEDVRDAIVGLADEDRRIVVSRPATGEVAVVAIQGTLKLNGKLSMTVEHDDVPVP